MIREPVLGTSECVKGALMWIIETGKRALLGQPLILPKPVYVKLVLLSPPMALMINLDRRLYASCVSNLT